jgi:hypothetical protein
MLSGNAIPVVLIALILSENSMICLQAFHEVNVYMLCCEWQFALLVMTVLKPEEQNGRTMTYDLLALFLTLARAREHTQMTRMCHHSHTYILLTSLTHRPTGTYMLQRGSFMQDALWRTKILEHAHNLGEERSIPLSSLTLRAEN